jgi:hypothetical protein
MVSPSGTTARSPRGTAAPTVYAGALTGKWRVSDARRVFRYDGIATPRAEHYGAENVPTSAVQLVLALAASQSGA